MDMLTPQDQEALREMRRNEVGTEPPCPFCKKPRVRRSDYIRCNGCAVNWLDNERHLPNYLNRNPAAARGDAQQTQPTGASSASDGSPAKSASAPTAEVCA